MVVVKVLVENKVFRSSLKAEHGLSLFVKTDRRNFLFDLGQTEDVFFSNASQLGVDLESISFIVLSHGHYDHTGALLTVSEVVKKDTVIYAHPLVRVGKYRKQGSLMQYIGVGKAPWDEVAEKFMVDFAYGLRQVDEGIYISGEIPDYGYPMSLSEQYVLENGDKDEFKDEVGVFLVVNGEVVVITGCSHRGVLNIVEHARRSLNLPVRAVVGGFHLHQKGVDLVDEIAEGFNAMGVKELYPMHCSGMEEICRLKERFSGVCEIRSCGDEIIFS